MDALQESKRYKHHWHTQKYSNGEGPKKAMSSRTERADYFPKARAEVENQSCIVCGKHGEVTGKSYRKVVMCEGP